MTRILLETIQVYALTTNGRQHIGRKIEADDGNQYGNIVDTGVDASDPWTPASAHRAMAAFAYDVARAVQNVVGA